MVLFIGVCVLSRGGLRYFPRTLANNVCLVEVLSRYGSSWEVWFLRGVGDLHKGFKNRWLFKFPSNEDFGSFGWSFSSRSLAERFIVGLLFYGRSVWIDKYREGVF